jgi:hypothetical protein
VAAELTTEGGDVEQLDPLVTAAERELQWADVEQCPEVVLADAGYWANGHIDALRAPGMILIVAPDTTRKRPRKTRRGGRYDFMRRVLASERGDVLYSEGWEWWSRSSARSRRTDRSDASRKEAGPPPARNGA